MTTTEKTGADAAAEEGRITDEDIERAKGQIGIPVHQRDEAWHKLPSADAITHFAFGCGDDNPLFHESDVRTGHALARTDRVAHLPDRDGPGSDPEVHRSGAKEVVPRAVSWYRQVLLGGEVDVVSPDLRR